MTKTEPNYCPNCDETTPHSFGRTNHILHLILSLLTAGIWLIVWLFAAICSGGKGQCKKCRSKNR